MLQEVSALEKKAVKVIGSVGQDAGSQESEVKLGMV